MDKPTRPLAGNAAFRLATNDGSFTRCVAGGGKQTATRPCHTESKSACWTGFGCGSATVLSTQVSATVGEFLGVSGQLEWVGLIPFVLDWLGCYSNSQSSSLLDDYVLGPAFNYGTQLLGRRGSIHSSWVCQSGVSGRVETCSNRWFARKRNICRTRAQGRYE